jgi:ferredoxin-NADP reductase
MLRLEVPDRVDHWPGQHYVIRLTAEDGYRAQRAYSISSAPGEPLVEFYIERLPNGEVSGYLADIVAPGDELEVRGPIGGWFVWRDATPAVAIGGGSGAAPIAAMLRHAEATGQTGLLGIAVSARTRALLPYAEDFARAGAVIAITRENDVGATRGPGRINASDLQPLIRAGATYFVCGSAAFAGAISALLLDLGVSTAAIRLESFGPSG